MSLPYDTIYGIPSVGGNATGNSDNGSLKHPGDYAPAQVSKPPRSLTSVA